MARRRMLGRGGAAAYFYGIRGRHRGTRSYWERPATKRRRLRLGRYGVARTMGPFAYSESKYFDSFLDASAVSESTDWVNGEDDPVTLNTLVVPVEGSDIDNRIGRKIAIYKIALRGMIITDSIAAGAVALNNPVIRIILYLDTQTNGTQSQSEELMATPGAADEALVTCTFQNLANLGRFRVLRDILVQAERTWVQDAAGTASQGGRDAYWRMTVKFKKPIIMRFNATSGGTVGDIVDNSFHIIANASDSDFATKISYQCRAYYKDK